MTPITLILTDDRIRKLVRCAVRRFAATRDRYIMDGREREIIFLLFVVCCVHGK